MEQECKVITMKELQEQVENLEEGQLLVVTLEENRADAV